MRTVCVYCSSSAKIAPVYFDATARMAELFVAEGWGIVFGGGSLGLMGKLADVALAKGGKVRGIMPKFMREVEWAHAGVEDFIYTESMHERKAKLIANSDALVALPGGTGTLEELFEAITLKRLGLYFKPIVILNTNGFYQPLKEMLEKCVAENFMSDRNLQAWRFVDEPEAVLPAIADMPDWDADAITFAAMR
ncbi:TIGR00730 family Rossman fold protein [Deltaproteobacteria bacterium Smac51]|nr:TIGR00730 family Rossman fold protein [Deltaproteobacteria bacterium Smac51]